MGPIASSGGVRETLRPIASVDKTLGPPTIYSHRFCIRGWWIPFPKYRKTLIRMIFALRKLFPPTFYLTSRTLSFVQAPPITSFCFSSMSWTRIFQKRLMKSPNPTSSGRIPRNMPSSISQITSRKPRQFPIWRPGSPECVQALKLFIMASPGSARRTFVIFFVTNQAAVSHEGVAIHIEGFFSRVLTSGKGESEVPER